MAIVAIAAVVVAMVLFRVRVAVAGGRLLLALVLIVGVVWLIARAGRSGGGRDD